MLFLFLSGACPMVFRTSSRLALVSWADGVLTVCMDRITNISLRFRATWPYLHLPISTRDRPCDAYTEQCLKPNCIYRIFAYTDVRGAVRKNPTTFHCAVPVCDLHTHLPTHGVLWSLLIKYTRAHVRLSAYTPHTCTPLACKHARENINLPLHSYSWKKDTSSARASRHTTTFAIGPMYLWRSAKTKDSRALRVTRNLKDLTLYVSNVTRVPQHC